MIRRLFTFGYGQTDPKTGLTLSNCYVWVEAETLEACREMMLERFGRAYPSAAGNWAFDYPDEEAAGVDRHKMRQIDFDTGWVKS